MRMAIIGSGLLATQIALQAAIRGFDVTVYNHRGDFTRFDQLLEWVGSQEESLRGRPLTRNGSLVDAIGDADVVLEAAAEDLGIKQTLFREIEKLARPDALLLTNSSNLLPAEISEGMAAPLRLVAMHFANMIWRHNVVEVMGQEDTPPELLERVADLGRAMGMAPVVIPKPVRGYLLNALLIPFLDAGSLCGRAGTPAPRGSTRSGRSAPARRWAPSESSTSWASAWRPGCLPSAAQRSSRTGCRRRRTQAAAARPTAPASTSTMPPAPLRARTPPGSPRTGAALR